MPVDNPVRGLQVVSPHPVGLVIDRGANGKEAPS
jgi:hypothetical protein